MEVGNDIMKYYFTASLEVLVLSEVYDLKPHRLGRVLSRASSGSLPEARAFQLL